MRLAWRIKHRPPAPPAATPEWQRHAAGIAHAALYVLMLAVPISGWVMSSAGGFPVVSWDGLTPGGRPGKAEDWLRGELAEMKTPGSLALVSHEPFLSGLVHRLTGRSIAVRRASCTVLHWDGKTFTFAAHFTPAELREG